MKGREASGWPDPHCPSVEGGLGTTIAVRQQSDTARYVWDVHQVGLRQIPRRDLGRGRRYAVQDEGIEEQACLLISLRPRQAR